MKKLDTILTQSVSLLNRLLFVPSDDAKNPESPNNEQKGQLQQQQQISQSALYSLLIKSIKNPGCNLMMSSGQLLSDSSCSENTKSNEMINKNNQFLLQLNLMMSLSNSNKNNANNGNLSLLNTIEIGHDTNWFYLLVKISIYKSNPILDVLLFSIFKKLSNLTPRLFGSLIGPFSNQFHSIILSKLKLSNGGQIVSTMCEFLCSLIEHQPGFFQTLADLRIESSDDGKSEKFVEGVKSILKAIFDLLDEFKKQENKVNYLTINQYVT